MRSAALWSLMLLCSVPLASCLVGGPVIEEEAWHRDLTVVAPPVLVGGILVVFTDDGTFGLDPGTGDPVWNATDAPAIWKHKVSRERPAVLGSTLYYPVFHTRLGILDATDGTSRLVDLPGPSGAPAIVDDRVVVPCGEATCGLDASGKLLWTMPVTGRVSAVHGDAWVVGPDGVTSLEPESGQARWHLERPLRMFHAAATDAGGWVVDEDGALLLVDPDDGNATRLDPYNIQRAPVAVGEDLLLVIRHGTVHRVAPDGESVWSGRTTWSGGMFQVRGDLLVGTDLFGGVSLLDAGTGRLLWYEAGQNRNFEEEWTVVHKDLVIRSGWKLQALRIGTEPTRTGPVSPTGIDDDRLFLEGPYPDSVRTALVLEVDDRAEAVIHDAHFRIPTPLDLPERPTDGNHTWNLRQDGRLVAGGTWLTGPGEDRVRARWLHDDVDGVGTGRPLWWLPGGVVVGGPVGVLAASQDAYEEASLVDVATGGRTPLVRAGGLWGHPTDPQRYATEEAGSVTVHAPTGNTTLVIRQYHCGSDVVTGLAGTCGPPRAPVVVGDVVYVGGGDSVTAIDWNGTQRWTTVVGSGVETLHADGGGVLVERFEYGDDCHHVTLTRVLGNGTTAWNKEDCIPRDAVPSSWTPHLAAASGVAAWAINGTLHAYDLRNGTTLWQVPAALVVDHGPGFLALADRVVFLDADGTTRGTWPLPAGDPPIRIASGHPAWAVSRGHNLTVAGPGGAWNETLQGELLDLDLRGGIAVVRTTEGSWALDAGALDGVRWTADPMDDAPAQDTPWPVGLAAALAAALWAGRRRT